jgi:fumarylacetoacetase
LSNLKAGLLRQFRRQSDLKNNFTMNYSTSHTDFDLQNPTLRAFIEVAPDSHFPIQNLPFGIFKTQETDARVGVRIGDYVLDLAAMAEEGYFEDLGIDASVFYENFLNELIAQGKAQTRALRNRIGFLLQKGSDFEKKIEEKPQLLYHISAVEMQLPVRIGDYTDFYSSIEHATNVGKMFRPDGEPLLPNWRHLPVAYHGRASSIVVSGTDIYRPKGQTRPNDQEPPVFGESKQLDFELEMAFIIGKDTELGESITTEQADDYIFGLVLFNDWSARDIQKWEYVPLGPFLSKNFASSMSAWVVTLDALEPFRTASPKQDPEVLDYLKCEKDYSFDINLEVAIKTNIAVDETTVCRTNFKYMYWNMAQQLAHHTVNGCNVRVGDVLASGTISGSEADSFGSMLELTWRGSKPLKMSDGTERKFIEDGDTVLMRGFGEYQGVRIGFGEVVGKILPAKK